jgi:hypothetical protein
MAQRMVRITRDSTDLGEAGRVWIVDERREGGEGTFSATRDKKAASLFPILDARVLVRLYWRGRNPKIDDLG